MPSPGNAESWPPCEDASSHPAPPSTPEALWSGEEPKTKHSTGAGLNPDQHLPQAKVGVVPWLSPGCPDHPTSHPPRTARATGGPADPNCFKLEGQASAGSSQVQTGPFPVTCCAWL